jgi:protein TonB
METKKTPQASLENKRVLFLELGLIVSLLAAIGAFSYSTAVRKVPVFQATGQTLIDEEIVPIIRDTPPEPPKAPAIPQFSEILTIVDDDVKTDDVVIFDDSDIEVPMYDYREVVVDDPIEEEEVPFVLVEQKPSFQGGDANDFSRWISQHLDYPEIAKANGVQGRVMVQFTVLKDGSVGNVKLLRGVDPSLDKEALRVVALSPKWEPGRQRDRSVNVTYQFPVNFVLR